MPVTADATLKLAKAEALKAQLEAILEGEPPYDIFVRWKPLHQQPLGWEPDINDGVRMNIRPFVEAGVLRIPRAKLGINWEADRGKDVASAPWYKLGPTYGEPEGTRINDHHTTLAEKKAATGESEVKFDAARALQLLRIGSGHPEAVFRDGQEEAIRHVVEGRGRLLVVQKTGWGKSFVYFIATKMLREAGHGPALLVSPLLALMRNQIAAAERMGVRAATINSDNQDDWTGIEGGRRTRRGRYFADLAGTAGERAFPGNGAGARLPAGSPCW